MRKQLFGSLFSHCLELFEHSGVGVVLEDEITLRNGGPEVLAFREAGCFQVLTSAVPLNERLFQTYTEYVDILVVVSRDIEKNKMAALRGNDIVAVPLKDATGELKVLNDDFLSLVKLFSR